MGKVWYRGAQRFVNQQLLVGVGQMVLTANDMSDVHLDVIDYHGQVVKRVTVRTQQHQIFDLGVVAAERASNALWGFLDGCSNVA